MITTSYKIADTDLVLDGERKYVLRVRDLPADEKPREKLAKYGPATLSVAELFAVVLQTGTKKEGVLEMVSRISREYGEKSLASQKSVENLIADLNLPAAKASQIIACLEIGRRFYDKKGASNVKLRTPREVFSYLADMRDLPKEHLRGIYLDAHYRVVHDEVISIGTINSNLIHPREVFRPAIERGAVAVILAHNHPSGIVKPSVADVEITRQTVEAGKIIGINLIDHIIVAKNKFESVKVDYE